MAEMGTQETDHSPNSPPESGHRDSDSRKQPVVTEYNVPIAVIGKKCKLTFAGWSRQAKAAFH